MDALQFAYWLQGFAEIHGGCPTPQQWQVIVDHLNLVFNKVTPNRTVPNEMPPFPATFPPLIPSSPYESPGEHYVDPNTQPYYLDPNSIPYCAPHPNSTAAPFNICSSPVQADCSSFAQGGQVPPRPDGAPPYVPGYPVNIPTNPSGKLVPSGKDGFAKIQRRNIYPLSYLKCGFGDNTPIPVSC